jgi:UDP-2,3-diacylglucosamine pyrophosphatase LpxH
MKFEKIFISDIHLGTKATQVKKLNEFLSKVETNELYLVGDIFDIWAWKKKIRWDKSHNKFLKDVLKFAKTKNVYFTPGNHDEAIRKFIPVMFDKIYVANYFDFIINDKKIRVLHGDQFDFVINKFPFLAWLGTWLYDVIIYFNIAFMKIRDILGLPYWSLSKYLKQKAKSSFGVLEKYKEHLSKFCETKDLDYVIYGHLHMPGIEEVKGKVLCNTGDWVENCSAIGIVNNTISLIILDTTTQEWEIVKSIHI